METVIQAIEYHLPEKVVSNQDLAAEFPEWTMAKIQSKTGIVARHVAAENECASDLAAAAARKLFDSGACSPEQIDFILLCTQSPDYFLPTTACLLQHRLGIPVSAGALDFNLGCSGYIYGLGMAQGLIETGQASNVLLLTAETYSKHLNARDRSVRTLFGDAAAATLLSAVPAGGKRSASYVWGTDGSGGKNLIVPAGGMRHRPTPETAHIDKDEAGNWRSADNIYMNGAEIFNFTLGAVPASVSALLEKTGKEVGDIDLFVFHQANQYMLDHLRKKLQIPREKFCVYMESCGNTVSSTIPIALKHTMENGGLKQGDRVMLVGFGVGYSWGATLLEWPKLGCAQETGSREEISELSGAVPK